MYSFKPTRTPDEAYTRLQELLSRDTEVYVIQRHVSRSGLTRYLSLFIVEDGRMRQITGLVAALTSERVYEYGGQWFTLKVSGTGMDMHFHTVYSLSRRIHGGDGYALNVVSL